MFEVAPLTTGSNKDELVADASENAVIVANKLCNSLGAPL